MSAHDSIDLLLGAIALAVLVQLVLTIREGRRIQRMADEQRRRADLDKAEQAERKAEEAQEWERSHGR